MTVRRARAAEADALATLSACARRAAPGAPARVHGEAPVRAWMRDVVLARGLVPDGPVDSADEERVPAIRDR